MNDEALAICGPKEAKGPKTCRNPPSWPWSKLENAANDATFRAHRSPIDRRSLRAGDKRHHGGYFFGAFKAFEERGGTYRLEELLFHFGFQNVLLFRHARDEIAGAFRRRRARQNRVHGDTGPGHGFRKAARDGHLGGLESYRRESSPLECAGRICWK